MSIAKKGAENVNIGSTPTEYFDLEEAYAYNLSPRDRREIKKIIFDHFEYIEQQWEEFQRRRQP